ncbi:MAG: PD40 domain-containing protein [Bacteroidales bacterium]|nr:PD40 domain-containing protein [Bacteroidales bacterium]
MRNFFKILWVLIFVLLFEGATAQRFVKSEKPDPKFAKLCMQYNNYYDALTEYQRLLKRDPNNLLYHYNSGICHLKLNKDKSLAIPEFLWVLEQEKYDMQVWYYLGVAYLSENEYDKAIESFERYQTLIEKDENRIPASRMIQLCENAKISISNPVPVEISNLGKHINTLYPEFNPYVPANETMLIFNSQRKTRYRAEDGYYPSDLYLSYFKFGRYRRTKRFSGVINSSDIEKVVGITPNGATMFVYTREMFDDKEHLMITHKRGKAYRNMEEVLIPSLEKETKYAAALSPNGKHMFVVAQLKEGEGGKDIYMCNRLPDGSWGVPNLDSIINTPYDENYPYFAPDGKSFFFASEGHNSIGGYDLFRCDYNADSASFSKPRNLGFPINTTNNDMTICLSKSMRYAYIASLRDGGFGDLDLYRVVMKEVEPLYNVISGSIFNEDSIIMTEIIAQENKKVDSLNLLIDKKIDGLTDLQKKQLQATDELPPKLAYEKLAVQIRVVDKKSNQEFGHFVVDNSTSKYNIILPPGEFKILFRRGGYKDYFLADVKIEERDKRSRYIVKHILLSKE